MSGRQPFSKLTEGFSNERKNTVTELANQMWEEMTLSELRQAINMTQTELAERIGVKQPAVSRLENRHDMYISHLREIIEAMGGTMVITAEFADRQIKIKNLSDLGLDR
jgi:predicted transcriptional regulator